MEDNLFKDIEKFLSETHNDLSDKIVTEEELDFAIQTFIESRGDAGATEEEVVNFIMWVQKAKLDASLVGMFFKGLIYIDDTTGQFKEQDVIVIRLTPLGIQTQLDLS